ncbi:hypothetical protein COCSUDRAFT_63305 [Coccomyxa subellipsoidea C-169]|uniref:Protein RIK n=1 Tax=Coccomyxa subellipsoidea (strain C-169) TaxID=574566 RepID=I0YZG4_COCSC|nr:hypothetical protein COCSUDRAFT_63305 [Coccomyxa subellipsoidea C-169]EIE23783.1 hypothetical protein COCSUDRAFT_63305 [Coccomyxa subellipsoidea C-169]|eukprot:XP_005648327.1 hypothetical protein COCSUDRAFT_63305 [Coccomyxa subellipsoidea C-169]
MTERRRRKWDVAAPQGIPLAGNAAGNAASSGMVGFITPQGAMGAAAPAPTPELAAQGKLPQGRGGPFRKAEEESGISRQVTINDAPPDMRHHLTKRPTQDDIGRRTGTQIVTRGRYMPPGMPPSDTEQPLYLFITPGASSTEDDAEKQRCVDAAAAEIQAMLQGQRVMKGGPYQPASQRPSFNAVGPPQQAYNMQPPMQPYGATPPAAHPGQYPGPAGQFRQPAPGVQSTCIWVGFEAVPDFNICQRLKGPNGSYLQHIEKETGATVALRGRGSGTQETEALHIFVSSALPKAFGDATKLAQNLNDTVRAEHAKAYPYVPMGGPPPAAGAPPAYGAAPPPQQPGPPYGGYGYPPPTAAPNAYPPQAAAPYGQPAGGYQPPYQPPAPGGYGAPPGYRPPPAAYAQRPPAYVPGHMPAPGQGYPTPYQQPQVPYAQQSPYGYPPPNGSATPGAPSSGATTPAAQDQTPPPPPPNLAQQPSPILAPSSQQEQAHAQQQSEGEQRKKRFKEFKEERQEPQQPPAYYAPAPDARPGGAASAKMPMGPPPPRQPQQPMGPPPPRFPGGAAGGRGQGSAGGGSFGGLVDYGDEED